MVRIVGLRVVAALLIPACVTFARPDSRVTIGAAALTFPETAKALSTDGRTVTCAPGLRERAAVICLRNRTWDETRALLGNGLGIRIQRESETSDSWVMEPDPTKAAQDEALRKELASACRAKLDAELAPKRLLRREPAHVILARALDLRRRLKNAEITDPNHDGAETKQLSAATNAAESAGSPFDFAADRLAASAPKEAFDQAVRGYLPFKPFNANAVVDVNAICRLMLASMEQESAEQAQLTRTDSRDGADSADDGAAAGSDTANLQPDFGFREIIARVGRGQIASAHRLHFDPFTLRFTTQQLYFFAGAILMREGITVQLGGGDNGSDVRFALGSTAARLAEEDKKATAEWMKSAADSRPVRLPASGARLSLSQIVQKWAEQNDREVVMELAPMREEITFPAGAESPDSDSSETPPPVKDSDVNLPDLVSQGIVAPAWSFRELSGVVVVRNGLDFVDRPRALPTASLLRFERERDRKSRPSDANWSFLEAVRFHSMLTGSQAAAVSAWIPAYRGMDMRSIASARFATMLTHLSPWDRAYLQGELARNAKASIPLSRFPTHVRLDICASLRAAALAEEGSAYDLALLDGFEERVAAGTMDLEVQDDAQVTLMLRVPIEPGSDKMDSLVDAKLTGLFSP